MIVTNKINIDLAHRLFSPPHPAAAPVVVMPDDKYSRNLEFTLTANGAPLALPENVTALVRFKKSDGTGGNYDTLPDGTAAYSISGNTVTVALAPQVMTAPGKVQLAVALIDGDAQLHTFAVEILVERNPGIDVQSGDYTNMRSYLRSSGWAPNKYLGTDENGNVVTKTAPAGGSAEAVFPASIQVVKADSAITVTTALEDGGTTVTEIALDEGEYAAMITTDGKACPVTWEGFEDEELTDVSEVGA